MHLIEKNVKRGKMKTREVDVLSKVLAVSLKTVILLLTSQIKLLIQRIDLSAKKTD